MLRRMRFFIPVTLLFCVRLITGQNAWVNEFHYDDTGADADEFIEVVLENPGSYTLSDFTVTLYNGNGGTSYDTKTLDQFTVGSSSGNFTLYYYNYTVNGYSIQNGAPDGFALDYQGTVISGQFLSYEGTFAATDGPANGMTSTDVGVSESGVPEGQSLQLSGSGGMYSDFTWQDPATNTMGTLNNGQTLGTVTNTVVAFAASSGSVGEGDGTYDLVVTITNPAAGAATSVDVVLISGDPVDINNYTTQTVTFPAGSSDNQVVTLTITDDSDIEGDEVLTFELQNVSGGTSAQIGSPSQFDLTILDNDFAATPNIVINEIMQNPSAVSDNLGEWFELYNADDHAVDMNGWIIKDNGSNIDTLEGIGTLVIQPGDYYVLGRNDTTTINGGVTVDYVYSQSFYLGNGSDAIILLYTDGISVVDKVEWDNGATFPDPNGKSMELNNPANDNNVGSNWLEALTTYGDGDYGTPGAQNSNFVSAIGRDDHEVVSGFKLFANYPNPFNPSTTIKVRVPMNNSDFTLKIYNVLGQEVAQLKPLQARSGVIELVWDGSDHTGQKVASGVYNAVLSSGAYTESIKMVLLR